MKQLLLALLLFMIPILSIGQITINSPSLWSDVMVLYGLDISEISDTDINVNAHLTIDVDYQFYGCHFTFDENTYLKLANGKEIKIDESPSNTSSLLSLNNKWNGIFVQNKNTLRMSNTIIENAKIGIDALSVSFIYLNNNLIESCDIGLRTNGIVWLYEMNNNIFGESTKGIQVTNSETFMNIAPLEESGNTFKNIDSIAIESINSSINVRNNSFSNCQKGVIMEDNTASRVKYNTFDGFELGIYSNNGFNTVISSNHLHSFVTFLSGGLPIRIDNSFHTRIYKNRMEQLHNYGIRASNNNKIYIEQNVIQGLSNIYGSVGGIGSTFNKSINISNNIITNDTEDSDLLGIYVNSCSSTSISKNEVNFNGTRTEYNAAPSFGVLIVGTNNASIRENVLVGDFEVGLELYGSSGAKIKCNDIKTTKYGIILASLSNAQYIRTNTLKNEEQDLRISCEIGQQIHLGNKFLGGNVLAENMTYEEIDASLFFVNSNENFHLPSNPNPAFGWFYAENDINDKSCYDINVDPPTTTPAEPDTSRGFYDEPIQVLKYMAHIEGLPLDSPKRFLQSFHLQSFYQSEDILAMPQSDAFGEINDEISNFDELLDLNKELFHTSTQNPGLENMEASNEILDQMLNQTNDLMSDEDAENLLNSLTIRLQVMQENKSTWQETKASNLEGIEVSLIGLECDVDLTNVWKEGMQLLTKYKKQDIYTDTELEDLNHISSLCIEKYGNPVYWARGILEGITGLYIHYSEECLEDRSSDESKYKTNESLMGFYPNPSNGTIELKMDVNDISDIKIFNMIGELVWRKTDVNNSKLFVNLNDGVYMININLKDGNTESKKLIIQK